MNRRGFFGLLGAAAATVALPELELLVPKRTIFLPPKGGWVRGNQLLTIDMIAKEALRVFTVNLELMATINREYSLEFSNDGGKSFIDAPRTGVITLRKPLRYASKDIRVGDRLTIEGVHRA